MKQIHLSGFSDEIIPDFHKQLEAIQRLGMSYIEIRGVNSRNISEYTADEAKAIKKALDTYGIRVSAIGSPCGKMNIQDDFESHFHVFQNVLELCKVLETRYIRIFSFYIPAGSEPGQYREQVLADLERMVNYAQKEDVILLHENEKEIYGDMADRCNDVLTYFNSPHLRGVFDFANFVQCRQDTAEAYEQLAGYIDYIHIKDAVWDTGRVVPAGMGDGRVPELLRRFRDGGYGGFLSVEPHLDNFVGFQGLERREDEHESTANGYEAFSAAANALKAILWDLDWR